MAFVYRRKGIRFWWMRWMDAEGKEQCASTRTENEEEARALAAETERLDRAKRVPRAAGPTVEEFFERSWQAQRRVLRPFEWKTDSSRLTHHFLPQFGATPIARFGTDQGELELLDWLVALPSHKVKGKGSVIGSRTVWNIASIVRVFFADAVERKVISRDPCRIWRADRHLPERVDKVLGWRREAGFTLEQVVTLTSDPRLPEDRRVLYALRFLGGGLRPGETSNARWRDLDESRRPLWRLTINSAFSTHMLREKSTKTGAELSIPVHPVLQAALTAWRENGWAEFIGRAPGPDDFIVPRQDGTQRRVNVSLEQFHADLATLGLPRQRQYESRSTFRNLCLLAGATEFHVNLITHPKPRQASDFYTRLEMQWPKMCEAVLHLDPAAWSGVGSSPREVTIGGDGYGTERKNPCKWTCLQGLQLVTRTGIEPMFSA